MDVRVVGLRMLRVYNEKQNLDRILLPYMHRSSIQGCKLSKPTPNGTISSHNRNTFSVNTNRRTISVRNHSSFEKNLFKFSVFPFLSTSIYWNKNHMPSLGWLSQPFSWNHYVPPDICLSVSNLTELLKPLKIWQGHQRTHSELDAREIKQRIH
jgi:hypothetical protein